MIVCMCAPWFRPSWLTSMELFLQNFIGRPMTSFWFWFPKLWFWMIHHFVYWKLRRLKMMSQDYKSARLMVFADRVHVGLWPLSSGSWFLSYEPPVPSQNDHRTKPMAGLCNLNQPQAAYFEYPDGPSASSQPCVSTMVEKKIINK